LAAGIKKGRSLLFLPPASIMAETNNSNRFFNWIAFPAGVTTARWEMIVSLKLSVG